MVPLREGDAARRELEVPDEPVQRPDLDAAHEVIERLEWADGQQEDTPHKRWRDVSRRTALTGGAAGVAAFILNACGGGKKTTSTGTTAAARTGAVRRGTRVCRLSRHRWSMHPRAVSIAGFLC